MSDKLTRPMRLLVAVLAVAYAAARLWGLTDSCLWFDEIFSIHAATIGWGGMFGLAAKDIIHPPFFYALLKMWVDIGGEQLLWLRAFPLLFSLLTLFPLLHLFREFKLSPTARAVGLGLIAFNGALIKYSQEVRMYSLLMFLSVLSIWLFSRFYFRGKNIWLLTLVNILLVYSHYFGWLVILTEIVVILVFQRIKIRHVLVMAAIDLAAFLPWAITVLRLADTGGVKQNLGWMGRPGMASVLGFAADLVEPFYFQQSSAEPASKLFISVPLLIMIVVSAVIYFTWKYREDAGRSVIFLAGSFTIVPVAAAFILSWLLPVSVWGSRHLIITFVPALILAGVVIGSIPVRRLRFGTAAAVFVLATIGFFVRAAAEPPRFIWCAWGGLARELPSDRPQVVYAFEDLVAYHLWYELRSRNDVSVAKVADMPFVTEDKAYFLPRGFDGVKVVKPDGIAGERFWIAFRSDRPNERHSPLGYLLGEGYRVDRRFTMRFGETDAELVELVQRH